MSSQPHSQPSHNSIIHSPVALGRIATPTETLHVSSHLYLSVAPLMFDPLALGVL